MKLKMTRLELIWLNSSIFGSLAFTLWGSAMASFRFGMFAAILAVPLGMQRWTQATKERKELEAKYAAHDAELLNQANKHHG